MYAFLLQIKSLSKEIFNERSLFLCNVRLDQFNTTGGKNIQSIRACLFSAFQSVIWCLQIHILLKFVFKSWQMGVLTCLNASLWVCCIAYTSISSF